MDRYFCNGQEQREMAVTRGLHLLVATDGSDRAIAAARYACTLVAPTTIARVTVLSVVRPVMIDLQVSPYGTAITAQQVLDELWGSALRRAHDSVRRTADELLRLLPDVCTRFRIGQPDEVILSTAREVAADLVVVGRGEQGGLSSMVRGTLPERVLRSAPCPALFEPGAWCGSVWGRRAAAAPA